MRRVAIIYSVFGVAKSSLAAGRITHLYYQADV